MTTRTTGSPTSTETAAARPLRTWQRRALTRYLTDRPKDFLAVATPGAGKTTFALKVAAELLGDRSVDTVTIVCPTEHLKHQWAEAAGAAGLAIDPEFSNAVGRTSTDFRGVAVTYAQVAAHPVLHMNRTEGRRTLVIFDEIHHAGDAKSWGEATREAFAGATRRLALTGTPFRSDDNPIPFIAYEPDSVGVLRSRADHSYGYADALADGVVRPVVFLAYSGQASWRTSAGEEMTARLGEPLTAEQNARAWKTALDPKGEWMPAVLQAADTRLTQLRGGGVPDAGGLVIATDHTTAKAYAALLRRIAGEEPVVVLSDDPKASGRIAEFGRTNDRWLVAVRMVSEGVDVPRLAVGVYATSASTPLFFAQAVGRFVRSRRPGETASVFLPSVPSLLTLASELEVQRDHVLGQPHRPKEGLGGRPPRGGQPHRGRAGRAGEGVRVAVRRGRARPADLRRVVLRHRGGRGLGRGTGLSRAARAPRARPGAGAPAPSPERAARPRGGVGRARRGGPGAVPVAGPRVPS